MKPWDANVSNKSDFFHFNCFVFKSQTKYYYNLRQLCVFFVYEIFQNKTSTTTKKRSINKWKLICGDKICGRQQIKRKRKNIFKTTTYVCSVDLCWLCIHQEKMYVRESGCVCECIASQKDWDNTIILKWCAIICCWCSIFFFFLTNISTSIACFTLYTVPNSSHRAVKLRYPLQSCLWERNEVRSYGRQWNAGEKISESRTQFLICFVFCVFSLRLFIFCCCCFCLFHFSQYNNFGLVWLFSSYLLFSSL